MPVAVVPVCAARAHAACPVLEQRRGPHDSNWHSYRQKRTLNLGEATGKPGVGNQRAARRVAEPGSGG